MSKSQTPSWLVSQEGPERPPPWATSSEGEPVPYLGAPSASPPGAAPPATPPARDDGTPLAAPPTPSRSPDPAREEADAKAQRANAMQRVALAIAKLEELRDDLVEQARNDAVELGLLIAREVVGAELRAGHDVAVAVARDAIASVGAAHSITVRVHPDDVAAVEIAGLAGPDGGLVDVVGDAHLRPGDVVVDTESGHIDARIDTRLDVVMQSVRTAVEAA